MRLILGLVLALLLGTSGAHAQQAGPVYCNQMQSVSGVLSTVVSADAGNAGIVICGWTHSAAAASVVTFSTCIANTALLTIQLPTTGTHGDPAGFRGFTVPSGDALCMSASTTANFTTYFSLVPGPTSTLFSGATTDCNFMTNINRGNCAVTTTRAGTNATDLLPVSASGATVTTFGANVTRQTSRGILVEESRVNQLFNSRTPATQTTGSLANATYTLWVNGSGSATMSTGTATGCGTGVAIQGTPINFTTSGAAGTCTVTVAGSLNAFQLEAGSFGTSLIVTAGATGTRAADVVTFTTPPTFGSAATVYGQGTPLAPIAFGTSQWLVSVDDTTTNNKIELFRALTTGNASAGITTATVAQITAAMASWAVNTSREIAVAGQAGSQAAVFAAGTAVTAAGASAIPAVTTIHVGSAFNGASQWNGWVERVTLWPRAALPTATLSVITAP